MTMTYEEIEQPTVPDQPPGDMEDERDAPAPPPPDAGGPIPDPAPYGYTPSGRIRKRPVGSRNRSADSGAVGSADAARAASVLASLNEGICVGLAAVKFTGTAGAILAGNDDFRANAELALRNDPKLCRAILRGGSSGGKLGLILAYVMLANTAGTVAIGEYRALAAEKAARDG